MENSLIDGRYRLVTTIGTGGEAQVFRARDEQAGSDVAVRLPQRFASGEPPKIPAILHEDWVKLISTGSDPTYGTYQVFELLEGQTLREMISTCPLDIVDWRILVDQSCDAVATLHAAGYVHGDINADNLFATNSGWKLLELPFHRLDPPEKRSAMFGSIHTLAPEQFDGAKPDVLTDIYSLGCLYYYAASGVYPHPGHNVQEVAIHCLRFPADPLAPLAPQWPAMWSDGVMSLVARRREDRPATLVAAHALLAVPVA